MDILHNVKALLEMFLTEGYSDEDALDKVWEVINGQYDDAIIEMSEESE